MRIAALTQTALAFAAIGIWAACTGQVPHPTPSQIERTLERWPGTDPGVLETGRSLYVARCGGCHNLYPPGSLDAARWPAVVDAMWERSSLSPTQRDDVLRYLVTVAPR